MPHLVNYRRANRQYVAMSKKEVWTFLSSRSKVFVAFTQEDGFSHVSPVWFCVFGGKLYLRTHDYKVKAKLARSGKACLSIDEGEVYKDLKGVIVWGSCRLVTEAATTTRIERIMGEKYRRRQWKSSEMPKGWVAERLGEKRAFIEIVPERVSSWDNSKV